MPVWVPGSKGARGCGVWEGAGSVSGSWPLSTRILVGQGRNLVKSAGCTEAVSILGFFSGKAAGAICRAIADNHCHSCCVVDTGNPRFSSLFLVISVQLSFAGLWVR